MNLSDQPPDVQRRVHAIAGEVKQARYANKTPAEITVAMNAPTTYTAVAPFGPADLKNKLSGAHLDAVVSMPAFDARILPLLEALDPKNPKALASIGLWLSTLAGCGRVSAQEFTDCAALLTTTATYTDGPSIAATLGAPSVQDFEVVLAQGL